MAFQRYNSHARIYRFILILEARQYALLIAVCVASSLIYWPRLWFQCWCGRPSLPPTSRWPTSRRPGTTNRPSSREVEHRKKDIFVGTLSLVSIDLRHFGMNSFGRCFFVRACVLWAFLGVSSLKRPQRVVAFLALFNPISRGYLCRMNRDSRWLFDRKVNNAVWIRTIVM